MHYQDTKPGSDDELAAIRLEGKVINTEEAKMIEMSHELFYYHLIFTICVVYLKKKKKNNYTIGAKWKHLLIFISCCDWVYIDLKKKKNLSQHQVS